MPWNYKELSYTVSVSLKEQEQQQVDLFSSLLFSDCFLEGVKTNIYFPLISKARPACLVLTALSF